MQLLPPNGGMCYPFTLTQHPLLAWQRIFSPQLPALHPRFDHLVQPASELFDAVALGYCEHIETMFSMLVTCSVPKQQGQISAESPRFRFEVIKVRKFCCAKNPPTGFLLSQSSFIPHEKLSTRRSYSLSHWMSTHTWCRQFNETAVSPLFLRSTGFYWSSQLSEIAHPRSLQHNLCLSTQWKSNSVHKCRLVTAAGTKLKKKKNQLGTENCSLEIPQPARIMSHGLFLHHI